MYYPYADSFYLQGEGGAPPPGGEEGEEDDEYKDEL